MVRAWVCRNLQVFLGENFQSKQGKFSEFKEAYSPGSSAIRKAIRGSHAHREKCWRV